MSILVIQLSPRQRLRASASQAQRSSGPRLTEEYAYALSPDGGLSLDSEGQCAASLLPKADQVVAVLSDTDVSWHRITLPKAPAAKMRTALAGLLEEAVLEDTELTHFALAPEATAGQPTWIAAIDRAWLRAELAALEQAHVVVDRVVPSSWPDDPPCGHFAETDSRDTGAEQGIALAWSHPDGVATMRLQGGLARALAPVPAPHGTRWSATPGAAASAEQWLGTTVNVMQPAQRLLQAARTLWNLRQFDLARRHRGTLALRDAFKHFLSPGWRPVRIGLASLVVAQIVGLNLWAWSLNSAVKAKNEDLLAIAKKAFPKVDENSLRRDAALVMQRETDALRRSAGKPGDNDFETLLNAAAAAWPRDKTPVENMKYENGRLTLATVGWDPNTIQTFQSSLRPAGWKAENSGDGRLVVSRNASGTP